MNGPRVLLAGSALLLGACGPTTDIYQAHSAPYGAGVPLEWNVEIDVEECRPSTDDSAPESASHQGFVETGRGCQLPVKFSSSGGGSVRELSLVGGPYRCKVAGQDVSLSNLTGNTNGDQLFLIVGAASTSAAGMAIRRRGIPDAIELLGEHDDSRPSQMICGLPSQPFTAAKTPR